MDDYDLPCTGCGDLIDVTVRHLTLEAKFEEHDPPGHVIAIGHATVISAYHEGCIPADVDVRKEEVGL